MSQKEQARTRTFSLYPTQEEIIEKAMNTLRRKNPSDTLQFIIEDWAQLKAELAEIELGKQARK